MLVLTSKEFEVEETIRGVKEGTGEILYEFKMQITPSEMLEIKDILFKDSIEAVKNEKEILEKGQELQKRFEEICFKEHGKIFKEKCGEYLYLDLVDKTYDFFMNAIIEKANERATTVNTNLKRIGIN